MYLLHSIILLNFLVIIAMVGYILDHVSALHLDQLLNDFLTKSKDHKINQHSCPLILNYIEDLSDNTSFPL